MPFHSRPRLKIEILSEEGVPSFKESFSSIVSFSDSRVSPQSAPAIRTIQRLQTGEAIEDDYWRVREVTAEFDGCVPGVRLFKVVFDGREFTLPFRKKKSASAIKLYRSILAEDVLRLTVVLEQRLYALDVELSYELHQAFEAKPEVPC